MTEPRQLVINPLLRWAVHPGHVNTLAYVDGMPPPAFKQLPAVGDVLTLPFIVDPVTRQPCPVRVVEMQYRQIQNHTVVTPVVARLSQD